jgi:hypothetical protein
VVYHPILASKSIAESPGRMKRFIGSTAGPQKSWNDIGIALFLAP